MKTAIIFYSRHHENTKKLLEAIKNASSDEIDLFDITESVPQNLEKYDRIGFASGIYYSKFEKRVLEFAKNNTPAGKKVFFIYTYSAERNGYTNAIREAISGKNEKILGEYGCLGFNTFGPFKLIGGIAKNHPDSTDISDAVSFYNNLEK